MGTGLRAGRCRGRERRRDDRARFGGGVGKRRCVRQRWGGGGLDTERWDGYSSKYQREFCYIRKFLRGEEAGVAYAFV